MIRNRTAAAAGVVERARRRPTLFERHDALATHRLAKCILVVTMVMMMMVMVMLTDMNGPRGEEAVLRLEAWFGRVAAP